MNTQPPQKYYPEVNPKPSFPEIEKRILAFWQERSIFQKSVDRGSIDRDSVNEFVFYDGPPFANGLPHYGHLLTGYVKDIVPRYQTLKGKKVDRRFGWDCHGLPAEMAAEKELQISGKNQITEYGIDRFNSYCQSSVLKYSQEWETYVTRQARWVDFINDYKTMDLSFMESVIWAFKQLWDKGLIYESYRVVPYSWAAESTLSNFE
ncbi:MAG: class I tRNA ligase family protein, partial [Microcoleus sp.]